MAINFPDPTDSTKYYYEGVTYTWDTNKWTAYGPTAGLLPVLADPSGNVVIKGNLSVNKNIDQNWASDFQADTYYCGNNP